MTTKNTPLDTLKQTAHVTDDLLEHVIDELGGSNDPTYALELLDQIRTMLVQAVAEHVPGIVLDQDSPLDGFKAFTYSPEARRAIVTFDDDSPVYYPVDLDVPGWASVKFYPRRDGNLEEFKGSLRPRLQLVGGAR